MHVINVCVQAHFAPGIARASRFDTAAELGPVDGEKDHRFHAHRLNDIQSNVEIAAIGAAVVARLGEVLRPRPRTISLPATDR